MALGAEAVESLAQFGLDSELDESTTEHVILKYHLSSQRTPFASQWGTAMMIKFLARGTGSAAAAADSLTREQNLAPEQDQDRDPEKNPEEVKVLRGNPHQVADVADALEFEHKYTSGVIAWAPEDKPSDAQIGRVVDEFEKTAWAGLEPDRYAWAARG